MRHSTRNLHGRFGGWEHGKRRGLAPLIARLTPGQKTKRAERIDRRKSERAA